MASELPQEIWWLVCQELATEQDFNTLFCCSLVSKSMANHALPLLYSIHELSNASTDDTSDDGKYKWAVMWRALILSSVNSSAYPYCLWIKSLVLGNLKQLLAELAVNKKVRDFFFEGPLSQFQIISGTSKTRRGRVQLEAQKIMEKVGDTITKFIRDTADQANKNVALTSLEAPLLLTALLSLWISRIRTLVSLSLQEGDVLTVEIAHSIRENCPSFKDLMCYTIKGPRVDENMSAFFRGLNENTLETFSVISSNSIGLAALQGLTHHSSSLRVLNLCSLENAALPALHVLDRCALLEQLYLEADSLSQPPSDWATKDKDSYQRVVSWLRSCKSLKKFGLKRIESASTLLAEVLKSNDLRLKSLDVDLEDDNEAFYSALGQQTDLEDFAFRISDEAFELDLARYEAFLDSVCSCKKLRILDIMHTKMDIHRGPSMYKDLDRISSALAVLEEFSFDGEILTDHIWRSLAKMSCLTSLNINGLSVFSFDGILSFIYSLQESGLHRGFRLYIMNQFGDHKLSSDEYTTLERMMKDLYDGRLELVYWRDPSEDELDLSD